MCVMIRTNYIVPLIAAAEPYKGFPRSAGPGLQVHQIEKSAFRRDREWRGQAGFGGKEGRESFSQCYERMESCFLSGEESEESSAIRSLSLNCEIKS